MLYIDGETYEIPVAGLKRTADFLDKYSERTETGELRRKLTGVFFNYELELGTTSDTIEYARLWDKLTEPVEFHTVTVPDESGDYTFTAYFSNISDELRRQKAGKNYWRGTDRELYREVPGEERMTWRRKFLLTLWILRRRRTARPRPRTNRPLLTRTI